MSRPRTVHFVSRAWGEQSTLEAGDPHLVVVTLDEDELARHVRLFEHLDRLAEAEGLGDWCTIRHETASARWIGRPLAATADERLEDALTYTMEKERAAWVGGDVVEGMGGVPAEATACEVAPRSLWWSTTGGAHHRYRTKAVRRETLFAALMYVGEEEAVREAVRSMARVQPVALARLLSRGVGPDLGGPGEADGRRRRPLAPLVERKDLRPLLDHEDADVRRAALEALGRGRSR